MLCYVDTSAWVALLGNEARAASVGRCLLQGAPWVTCAWTELEIASALSIKARRGELTPAQVVQACKAYRSLVGSGGVAQVDCVSSDFSDAALLCAQPDSGLRAGDALHLAVSLRLGCTHLLAFDLQLNRCAQHLGLSLLEPA